MPTAVRTAILTVIAIAGAAIAPGTTSAQTPPPIISLLDRYAAGQQEEVVAAFAGIGNVDDARKDLEKYGRAWIDGGGPEGSASRRLALATFALELADARKHDDWIHVRRLLEWTSGIIRNGEPSDAERIWHRAAIALHQGMRKWDIELIPPARERFPYDRRLAFSSSLAKAAYRVGSWRPLRPVSESMRGAALVERVLDELQAFVDDPEVGGEAHVWIGLISLLNNELFAEAMQHFAAGSQSADPFVAYLANYSAGRVQESAGRITEAEGLYRAALVAIPRAQSASLSLSALLFTSGRPDEAYEVARVAFDGDPPVDPFHNYGLGDAWRFPGYLAHLRREVRR